MIEFSRFVPKEQSPTAIIWSMWTELIVKIVFLFVEKNRIEGEDLARELKRKKQKL